MAEVEARGSLSKLREAWPSINGLSNSPDEPVEWARLPPDGKMLRTAAMQQAVSRADADAPVAALFATLEADARGPAARPKDQALADLSRLRSISGALASAWLTARPGFTELTAIEVCVNARLRLGEILLAGQDGDAACVCGRLIPSGATHSLICGALWRTVVARHNGMAQAWCRAFSQCSVACALEPHVQQLPKVKRAAGLWALPARDNTTTIRAHGLPRRTDPPLHNDPQSTRASAAPSTPHGTQALTNPSQPDLALMACPPMTAQSSEPRTAAQQHPAQQEQQRQWQQRQQQPHPPPLELPPRSQRDPQRGDLLAFLPGRPIVMDVCVTHPLAASAVAAAAWTTGATAEAKDALKRNKYSRTGTGACRLYR